MGDILDFMAWSAASDASQAAKEAKEAVCDAENRTRTREQNNKRQATIKSLNKMLQDLFYGREIEYYQIKDILKIVDEKYPYKSVLPIGNEDDKFPFISLILGGGTLAYATYILFHNSLSFDLFNIALLVFGTIALGIFVLLFKRWDWWVANKNRLQKERLDNIQKMYEGPMRRLANELSMLSRYGIVRKYNIDSYVSHTYKLLYDQSPLKAKNALMKLYNLVMEFSDGYKLTDKDMSVTNIFLEYPEIKKLNVQGLLFQQQALELYEEILKAEKQQQTSEFLSSLILPLNFDKE
jgi:hypothetical protein